MGLFASFQRLDGQSVRVETETGNHALQAAEMKE